MRNRSKIVFGLAIALALASPAAAQRRGELGMAADLKADVAITMQVAGQPYHFEGKAECLRAPVASIYGVMAEMWSVRQSDGKGSVMLTLWRPRNMSGDMVALSVTSRGRSYLVNTIKAAAGSAVQGSGKVTFTPSGAGGTFTIFATTANGAAITGTIKCSAFSAAIAEGGE